MGLRSLACLAALASLAACTYGAPPATPPLALAPPPPPPAPPAGPPHIAILLPLTGPMANLAAPMLQAAQLALSVPGSPVLDVHDTAGDPARAAQEAQAALQAGDRLILGPLTAAETTTVGAVASAPPNGMPVGVLAFTSDPAAAAPGVWTLGLTPGQQVRRLVGALREDGRQHVAAILPQGALGDALQSALEAAAVEAGLDTPAIQRSEPGLPGFTAALKTVSNYEGRRGELAQRLQALRNETDPAARAQATALAAQPVAAPPFDALLIGETGPTLVQASEVLSYYDAASPQVRVLGPALWAQQAGQLGHMAGAWYASLDPASRQGFVAAYQGKYGAPPNTYADFAFDGAAIAHVLASENDFSTAALTRAEGFTGVDGALALLPGGQVRRALAIFQINGGGGAHIVSQAPQDVSQPGS